MTKTLAVREFDYVQAYKEIACNAGDDLEINSNSINVSTKPTQKDCFNYQHGTISTYTFNPPTISDPATCNDDAQWLYSVVST